MFYIELNFYQIHPKIEYVTNSGAVHLTISKGFDESFFRSRNRRNRFSPQKSEPPHFFSSGIFPADTRKRCGSKHKELNLKSSSGKNPVQWEKYRTIEKNARFSLERPVREQLGSEFADREGAGCLIVLSINQSSAWPGFELLRKKSISPRKVSLLRDSG
jgi:hypothetical protein